MTDRNIPSGWQRLPLGEIVIEKNERVGNESSPVILSSTKYHGLVSSDEYFKRRVYSNDISKYKLVRRNWFAYATNHLNEGSIGLQMLCDLGAVSPMYTVFEAREDVDPAFLFRVLKSPQMLNNYRNKDRASVDRRGGVRFPDFASIRVSIPPYPEQRRISKVLDGLDAAINHSEEAIAKFKQVRVGLVHNLLTCGIDKYGELRDPITKPEEFEQKGPWLVPRTWTVMSLGQIVKDAQGAFQTGPFGSQLHAYEYVDEGIPVVMPQDIQKGQITDRQIVRVTSDKAEALSRHRLKENDVVFGRRGDLARCACVTKKEVDWLCGTDCLLIRISRQVINGKWLVLTYSHHRSQSQARSRAVGSTMVGLNTGLLSNLLLAIPEPTEQDEIVRRIEDFNSSLGAQESEIVKLKKLKEGLLYDLLTGNPRLTNDKQIEV
jgi:type I restriction enzyme S subunit